MSQKTMIQVPWLSGNLVQEVSYTLVDDFTIIDETHRIV